MVSTRSGAQNSNLGEQQAVRPRAAAIMQVFCNPLLLSIVSEFTPTLRLDATCSSIKEARSEFAKFGLVKEASVRFFGDLVFRARILGRVKRPSQIRVSIRISGETDTLWMEASACLLSQVCVCLHLEDQRSFELRRMNVTALEIYKCVFDAACSERLAASFPNLTRVRIIACQFDLHVLSALPKLTDLRLHVHPAHLKSGNNIREEMTKLIAPLGNLTDIWFPPLDLALLGPFPKVKRFASFGSRTTNVSHLSRVFPNVHSLDLLHSTNNSLDFLAECKHLVELTVDPDQFRNAPPITSLKRLHLRNRQVVPTSLTTTLLERAVSMEKLEMLECHELTPHLVPLLAQAKSLISLKIHNADSATIQAVSRLTNIRLLYVEKCAMMNLEALADMSRLEVLDLKDSQFWNLASLRASRSLQIVRVSSTTPPEELESVKDWSAIEIYK